MDERDFNGSVSAEVPAKLMEKLYLRLENEATPHSMRVRKGRRGTKQVTISCDAKDVAYFNNIVTDENKTEI